MSAPSGYTALDFIGFTDKGTYATSATYMRNDLVHYGGNIMRCLIDNTTNIAPVVGVNWELWVGASASLAERTIAPLENNPADVAYGVGRQIIYDDWLWEVIAPIAVGDNLVDYAVDPTNANIKKASPVETQLLNVKAEADATDNMIAPTETNASASSAAYAVGDHLILNNILYRVTAAISQNDPLATSGAGANITSADNLTDQIATKANASALGTAAAKNSTNAVTQSSTDLVESGAVYSEVSALNTALTNQVLYFTDVACTATTGTFAGVSDSRITADHVVTECVFSIPSAITSDVSWSTSAYVDGNTKNLVLSGTCANGNCTANLVLVKKGN